MRIYAVSGSAEDKDPEKCLCQKGDEENETGAAFPQGMYGEQVFSDSGNADHQRGNFDGGL